MFRLPALPRIPTAPFCPSEVRGCVAIPPDLPLWKKLLRFAGPGLLVSVGYMDPGNWATDIEAGSRYGYSLLFVVLLSSLAAMVLQCLSARLGIVTGKDLARLSRERYRPGAVRVQWLLAELSIVACDLAEVLGCALAFHLLLGVPILGGVALTALDTLIVLGLKGKNFRQLEAIVLGLILTIGLCYFVELALIRPHWPSVAGALVPSWQALSAREPLYLAIGILGATVMPHNLYLHSSIVQTRVVSETEPARREAVGLSRLDTIVSLSLALLVNGAILVLAAAAFHANGHQDVADIQDAHRLLEPIVGTAVAGVLFGIALLAAGQSSTFTGTIAGQILMEGFLEPAHPLLAAAARHAGAGADPRLRRRGDAGRPCHRQAAGDQPGGAGLPAAVRDVSADPHDGRPRADGHVRQRPADIGGGVVPVRGHQRGEPVAGVAGAGRLTRPG